MTGIDEEPGAPVGCPAGTTWRYRNSGGGWMSHLGRMEFDYTHCTVFDEATGAGSFGTGVMTWTAANGDTLTPAQSGMFAFDESCLFAVIEGTWMLVDGDGRFEDAAGSGTFSGIADIIGGTTTSRFHGRLEY